MKNINFDEEIKRHLQWRLMIEAVYNGGSEAFITPSVITTDERCHLGKWIHSSDSDDYKETSLFQELDEAHKEFHFEAGLIFSLYQQNKIREADAMKQKFYILSNKVVNILEQMKTLAM